jgi:2,5-diketo-D-gluconate reductase A
MAQQPTVKLNDGNVIPQLGLGVWQVPPEITERVVSDGIKAGFRSIDTAEGYNNEQGVGAAIKKAEVPRDELFITSKLRNGGHAYGDAMKSFDETMEKLGLERLDMFLIHWPVPSQGKYVEAWKALVQLQKDGRVRTIGVSNFNPDHIERIVGETGVTPAVNQIELHPRWQQRRNRPFFAEKGIHVESWSPLGTGRELDNPVIGQIAKKHGKSPAQTIIRWHLQQGLIVIPKTTHADRMAENIAVFDFELDQDDMRDIEAIDDANGRKGADPATASFLF